MGQEVEAFPLVVQEVEEASCLEVLEVVAFQWGGQEEEVASY